MNQARLLMTGLITLCVLADRPATAAFVAIAPSGSVTRTQTTEYTPSAVTTNTYNEVSGATDRYSLYSQRFRGRGGVITLTQASDFILKYDLSLLAGADISAATLDFTLSNVSNVMGFSASGGGSSTASATSLDFTGANSVSVPGGTRGYSVDLFQIPPSISFDAGFIRTLVQAGVQAVAFRFNALPFDEFPSGLTINAPRLNVTYGAASVPEPSSLALCSLAGVGLLGVRVLRRRSAARRPRAV